MLHELASADVLVPHHVHMHVTGQVVFCGEPHGTTIVVETPDGSSTAPVDLISSVDTRDAERHRIHVRGDTREPLTPGAYRVKLLAADATRVVIARVGHVLLSSAPPEAPAT